MSGGPALVVAGAVGARGAAGTGHAGFWLVLAAATFNAALCFGQTQGLIAGSTLQIMACEAAILAIAAVSARHAVSVSLLAWGTATAIYVASLSLLNSGLDVKILRDIALAVIFFCLGSTADLRTADRSAKVMVLVVIAVGLFELIAPDVFGRVLNIWDYYVSKGVIDQDQENYTDSNLFVSGNRGADMGRFWFEFVFGSHRVSSIFLEPTSMGNFGILCAAWFVSRFNAAPRSSALFLLLTFVVIIFGDSRFASLTIFILVLARITGLHRWSGAAFLLPIATMSALATYGAVFEIPGHQPELVDDNFAGRLLLSGQHLLFWDWRHWFALVPSPVTTVDTGYAYFINNFGIIPTLMLWAAFTLSPVRYEGAAILRLQLSIYISTALCIGASIFSIKTAALCWFLYGAMHAAGQRSEALRGAAPR